MLQKKRIIKYNGKAFGVNEWAREIGINQASLSERLSKGWTLEKTLGPKTRYAHKLNELVKCTKCGKIYPWLPKYFTPRRRIKSCGCEQPCQKCTKILKANSKVRKASRKAYYKTHQADALAYAKEWYLNNTDEARAKSRAYYYKNRKKRIEATTRWNKAHPLKGRLHGQRRRTKMVEQKGQINRYDIELQYKNQKGRCWWCKIKLNDKYHIDHRIPLSRGGRHDRANIVIACPSCNMAKGAKLPWEFCGRLL